MCSGSEAGSCFRRIDSCITQLKAQGPSRTCNESQEEEEVLLLAGGHTGINVWVEDYRGTSLIRNRPPPLGSPRTLGIALL